MKRLFVLGTIAALALGTTAQAKDHKGKQRAARQVVTRQQINNTGNARFAPAGNRTVVRRYSNGGRYYGRGYYGGGYSPYYGSGSSFSIGIGSGGFGYPGYGYGYPYSNYGYGGYPYTNYGYNSSPYGYNNYRTGYARGYNVVAEVQRRLADAGYYHGVIDGAQGPRTRAAIARYEARHGMYADGRIDQRLLRSLGLG
jgi:hypothetical protein